MVDPAIALPVIATLAVVACGVFFTELRHRFRDRDWRIFLQRIRHAAMIAGALYMAAPAPADGQTAEVQDLVTDRPDFTESAIVVPLGSVQLEGGFSWERGNEELRTASGPELLVRWGLTHRVELRLGSPDYVDLRGPVRGSGVGDASVGTKVQIGPFGSWDLASVISVSLPTGEDNFSSEGWDPSVILTTGRDLAGVWSVGSQVFAEWATLGEDREFIWGGTLVLGASLGESTGSFLEIAVTDPELGETQASLHHGYTHLLTRTLQVDVHGGIGLTDSASDVFLGAGICIRR